MFTSATDVQVSSRSLLRAKEARALREAVALHVSGLRGAAGSSALETLLPDKAGIEVTKLASRLLGYSLPGGPLLFINHDPKAAAPYRLMPTLACVWASRHSLPIIHIHAGVSSFILRGADLMLPGVAGALPLFREGEYVSVCVEGNPSAIAVGEALLSSEAAVGGGMKGKGVRIITSFGDALWAASGRLQPAGFSGDRIEAVTADESSASASSLPPPSASARLLEQTPVVASYYRLPAASAALYEAVCLSRIFASPSSWPTLPGVVLARRNGRRGGAAARRRFGSRLETATASFCTRARARMSSVVLPQADGETDDDDDDGGDDDDGDGGLPSETTPAAGGATETAHALTLETLSTAALRACLFDLRDNGVTFLMTQREVSALLNEYVALRALADTRERRNVFLDEPLAQALAKSAASRDDEGAAAAQHDGAFSARLEALRTHEPDAGAPSLPRESAISLFLSRCAPWWAVEHRAALGAARELVVKAGTLPRVLIGKKTIQGKRSITWLVGFQAYRLDAKVLASALATKLAASATLTPSAALGVRHDASLAEAITVCGADELLAVTVQGDFVAEAREFLIEAGLPPSALE
jgi:predicted RNA-binding protein (TIGR00451 family)